MDAAFKENELKYEILFSCFSSNCSVLNFPQTCFPFSFRKAINSGSDNLVRSYTVFSQEEQNLPPSASDILFQFREQGFGMVMGECIAFYLKTQGRKEGCSKKRDPPSLN